MSSINLDSGNRNGPTGEPLAFDPYQTWLHVSHEHRPLNPYQLLGLDDCEMNPQKIDAAIRKQRFNLDQQKPTADFDLWQRVKEELEAAVDQISTADKKTLLDAAIRRKNHHLRFRETLAAWARSPENRAAVNVPLPCSRCEQENPGGRTFCAGCGEPLWKQCVACQQICAATERFCGGCGTNLEEAEEKALKKYAETLEEARQAAKSFDYDQATRLARQVARLEDARFATVIDDALKLLDEISLVQKKWRDKTALTLAQARELVERKQYPKARRLIEQLPKPFWTDDLKTVYRNAERKSSQLDELLSAIRTAVEARNVMELGSLVEQLGKIEPEHDVFQRLLPQVASKLMQRATAHLGRREFSEARKALACIPVAAVDDKTQRLIEQADELSWLRADVRESPVVDPPLIQIVQRYVRSLGDSSESRRLLQQLKQRQSAAAQAPSPLPAWAAAPAEPPAVGQVQWLGTFGETVIDSAAQDILSQHPGEFFAAAGLALQGVGPVHIATDLARPLRKTSLLSPLKKGLLRGRGDRESSAWGIDVGNHSLKAVRLVRRSDGTCTLQEAVHVPFESPLSRSEKRRPEQQGPEPRGKEEQLLASALDTLKEACEFTRDSPVFASVSTQSVLGKFVHLPPVSSKQFAATVQHEMAYQFPYRLQELAWDYGTPGLNSTEGDAEGRNPTTVLLAAKRQLVEKQLQVLEDRLGIAVAGIQPDVLAAVNWIVHDHLKVAFQDAAASPVALLDVGSQKSVVAVVAPDNVWFRAAAFGGDRASQAIARNMSLTFSQAEQLKREPHRASQIHVLFRHLEAEFRGLADELLRSLTACEAQFGGLPSKVWAFGGGLHCHGLLRYLLHGPHFSDSQG